jgi:cytochrome c oxidase subunit IV
MSEAAAPHHGTRPPEEPHGVSTPAAHHAVNYLLIFYALVALTILTVLLALHRFDNELANVLLALLLATVKAGFVATYFMHLKFEGRLIYLILFAPLFLTVALIISLIPDIGRGLHHVMTPPPIVQHDAQPLSPY